MTHQEHVTLIKDGVSKKGGVWADFGSGEGAFTLALRDVLGESGIIYSIEQDTYSLSIQKAEIDSEFPQTTITYLEKDFIQPLDLPPLDGIIAANSIHFYENTAGMLELLKSYLKPNGTLIIVEYNVDEGNVWVPYPFSFTKFEKLAKNSGFTNPQLLNTIPSQFLTEIYAASAISI